MGQSDKFGMCPLVDTVGHHFFRFEMPIMNLGRPVMEQLVHHWFKVSHGVPWSPMADRTLFDNDDDNGESTPMRDQAVSVWRSGLCKLPPAGDQSRAPW